MGGLGGGDGGHWRWVCFFVCFLALVACSVASVFCLDRWSWGDGREGLRAMMNVWVSLSVCASIGVSCSVLGVGDCWDGGLRAMMKCLSLRLSVFFCYRRRTLSAPAFPPQFFGIVAIPWGPPAWKLWGRGGVGRGRQKSCILSQRWCLVGGDLVVRFSG